MRYALCLLASLSAACAPSNTIAPATDTTAAPSPSTSPAATSASTAPGPAPSFSTTGSAGAPTGDPSSTRPGAPTEVEAKALATSVNAFATDLYALLRNEPGNFAVSPASISLALTMTRGGAKGDTATQMAKVLYLGGDEGAYLDGVSKQLSTWNDPARTVYTLRVTNRLFGEKSYVFQDAFLKKTASIFGAPLEPADFLSSDAAADAARIHINGWVAKETSDRIKDLLPPKALDKYTRLVLVNAVYFLGNWATAFSKANTRPLPFHASKASATDVPTMNLSSQFKVAAVDGVRVLEMPYKGNELAMDIVLPDAKDGLPAVEKQLTVDKLKRWMDGAAMKKVNVFLPAFEVNPPKSLLLNEPLSKLGMPLAFDQERADFAGIANPLKTGERLFISKVFHKAFVKVDEKGTEAAAATGVVVAAPRGIAMPEEIEELRADHPFLFFVRDLRSGMILFMGRMEDPTKK